MFLNEVPIFFLKDFYQLLQSCKVAMATLSPQMAMTIDCDKLLSVPSGLLGEAAGVFGTN